MSPPKLPIEILLMIARLLTDKKGKLRFADFNSFLQVNRALYACLNRTLWREAALEASSITERVFTHLIRTNDLGRLEFFLELGADTETVLPEYHGDWSSENTPLKVVSRLDNVPMARLLLEHDAGLIQHDLVEKGQPGYSAIHVARSAQMVQLLLDHHADPEQHIPPLGGARPLIFYADRGNVEAMWVVLRNGAKVHRGWDISLVRRLLEYSLDIGEKDVYGNTPLESTAGVGKIDVVKLLLEHYHEASRENDIGGQ